MNDVTQILDRVQPGDPLAAGELLPLVYEELRRIACSGGHPPSGRSQTETDAWPYTESFRDSSAELRHVETCATRIFQRASVGYGLWWQSVAATPLSER